MVASISARGNAKAALAYYDHLRQDDYYTRDGEPPGRWAGGAAARLSLQGPVTQSEFDAALNGLDPKTGERLTQRGGQSQSHAAGWDMTFSAPKSVSVLWALSEPKERAAIEAAQRTAVMEATRYLEKEAAWSRRGQGGKCREQAAGLLAAQFDHYTSRELDPQLHTHCFIFNLAPRKDGSWGAIVSRELYKAQKQAGAVYRDALAKQLQRHGHVMDRNGESFRLAAIPRHVERAFSKRRLAIEQAAETHSYAGAKGMELATLRTRRAKKQARVDGLLEAWQLEAKTIGFQLTARPALAYRLPKPRPQVVEQVQSLNGFGQVEHGHTRHSGNPANPKVLSSAAALLRQHTARLLRALQQPTAMPPVKLKLHNKDLDRDHS